MKDTGKSSSRKLRRAIYYTLHRTDPQKTHYKNSFCATPLKTENWGKHPPICPLERAYLPLSKGLFAPLRPLSGSIGDHSVAREEISSVATESPLWPQEGSAQL